MIDKLSDKLSNKLIIKIFDYLDHEGLMKMYEIDTYKNIIKNNVWRNIIIKLVKKKRILKFIENGWINCFVKYDLSNSEIDNGLLKYFSHCDYLDLYKCNNLEPGCTKYIKNCCFVVLSNTNIIDDDIKILENVKELNISNCKNITIDAIQYLKNIKILNIEMTNINKEHFKQCNPYIQLSTMYSST